MNRRGIARVAGLVCLAGATVQIIYGLLAVVFPYPAIIESSYEVLWMLVNVGMIGGVVGWLAVDVARPRLAARIGGGLAIAGHLSRIAVSLAAMTSASAAVDLPIVASIVLMFLGMGTLGVATLRGKRLSGWARWVPLLTVAAGLVTASFYSIDRVVHFVLLGLFWGPAWLLIGYVLMKQTRKPGQITSQGRRTTHPEGPRWRTTATRST
jgi:hypothetical protein